MNAPQLPTSRLLYPCRSGIPGPEKTWQFETLCTEVWYCLRSATTVRGMTGDTYGAVNEVAEVTVLLLGIALFSAISGLFQAPF